MIQTNAAVIERRYRAYRSRMDAALALGVRDAAVAVHNEAFDRLSGGAAAPSFSYPVPVRHPSGGLRSRLGFRRVSGVAAIVFNTDPGAYAVHSGISPNWGGEPPRPFLDDAVIAADPSSRVRARLIKAFA
ncbi:MAG: hypothetical protein KDI48_06970 [Xanthomonadales bacterium]|nr:hypothetical protein [Xanthomonadales bacterium]